jgi:hypothetical protein
MLLFIVLALLVKLTRSLIPLLATEVGLDATAALAQGLDASSEDSGASRNSSSIAALLDATGCMRARRRGANAYPRCTEDIAALRGIVSSPAEAALAQGPSEDSGASRNSSSIADLLDATGCVRAIRRGAG